MVSHNYWKVGKDLHIVQNAVIWKCSSKTSQLPYKHPGSKGKTKKIGTDFSQCHCSLQIQEELLLKKYKYSGKPRELSEGFLGLTLLLLILLKENIIWVFEKVPPKQPKYQMSHYWKTSVKDYWDFYHSFVLLHYMYSIMNTVVETEEICWLFDNRV